MRGEQLPSAADLEQLERELAGLDSRPCHFAHEDSDLSDPPQCPVPVQEGRLGCAHSGQVVLREAVRALTLHPRSGFTEGEEYLQRLDACRITLARLDIVAMHDYDTRRSALPPLPDVHAKTGLRRSTLGAEQEKLAELDAIRNDLLERIRQLRAGLV